MEPSEDFKAWLKEHEREIEEHFNFAVQAFGALTRTLPSPQGEILMAAIVAAISVREYNNA